VFQGEWGFTRVNALIGRVLLLSVRHAHGGVAKETLKGPKRMCIARSTEETLFLPTAFLPLAHIPHLNLKKFLLFGFGVKF